MDTRRYNRLLMQLLLLPLLALLALAVGLAYSLHRLERSAAWVDHSDEVIGHANRLIGLMVDEETGLRGYLLTRDVSFLEPYYRAERELPQEFHTLFAMVRGNPAQIERLQQLQTSHDRWNRVARPQLDVSKTNFAGSLMSRKREMDNLRVQADGFLRAEKTLRRQRSTVSDRMDARVRSGLILILVLVGLVIAWVTLQTFSRLRKVFLHQLEDAQRQRDEADARQRWLNTTMRSIGDGVIACDSAGRVVFMNPVAERVTGWTEQEAKGEPLPKLFYIVNETTRVIVEDPVEKVLRTGGVVGLANHTVLIRRDGSECAIDDSAAPIQDASGRTIGIVLVFRDCTERRRSELVLMRAEKLAAAGKLAASIAHEVNNPLEGITNMLYLAGEANNLREVRGWLAQAQSEVNRLNHITRQTLGFYRENALRVAYRPADVVEEVLRFYIPEARSKNVELQAQIHTRQETYGVPGELRQVLSNLISNSLDAMSNGGVVRLVVRPATDVLDGAQSGVRISVVDTGSGIPAHIVKQIFEPFFTTKAETGTGLGLWVSKELVEKQGGRLGVRSSASGSRTGTVFSIFMPIRSASDTHSREISAAEDDTADLVS